MFFKKKREYIPIMYYKVSEPAGNIVDSEDFPIEYMDKICLMLRRLKDMGVIESEKFHFYSVPKIMEILDKADILKGVPLPKEIDTVGIVFGRKYAGWWHGTQEKEHYLIPFQMVFYHDKKAEEYFLSQIALKKESTVTDGLCYGDEIDREFVLDLSVINVKYTNTDDPEIIVKNTKPVRSDKKLLTEIRIVYHLTFAYLKYFLLLKKDTLGYKSFISWLAESFEGSKHCMFELSQYFGINTDSYAATRDVFFETLVLDTLRDHAYALDYFCSSPQDIFGWIQESLGRFEIPDFNYDPKGKAGYEFNRFEVIRKFQTVLERFGLQVWAVNQNDIYFSTVLVISKEDSKYKDGKIVDSKGTVVPVPKGLNVEVFSDDFVRKYDYLLEDERRNRKLADKLYPLIGLKDPEEAQKYISGNYVLDKYLYEQGYVTYIDYREDTVNCALAGLLEAWGLYPLAREIEEADPPLEIERYGYVDEFQADTDEITPVDRMALYVPLLKKHGKLLCYLDLQSDSYQFVLADNKPDLRTRLERVLREADEIAEYKIL